MSILTLLDVLDKQSQFSEEDIKNLESQSIVINGKKENFTLEDLKGIIISELEVGYYYSDGEKRVIIKPSKVVVGE